MKHILILSLAVGFLVGCEPTHKTEIKETLENSPAMALKLGYNQGVTNGVMQAINGVMAQFIKTGGKQATLEDLRRIKSESIEKISLK